jgi:hypothetical protein
MINSPYASHTLAVKQVETVLGSGNVLGMATLTFSNAIFNPRLIVPITHTELVTDWVLQGGQSSATFIERCEFRASFIPVANFQYIKKGLLCSLVINPNIPAFQMQLWHGGLIQGGEIFRFMLTDANYKG